jgi:hypothetical protein
MQPTITHVFYSPVAGRTIDIVDPISNRAGYSGLTQAQLSIREEADIQIVTWQEAELLTDQADRTRYCVGARRVTAERADEALNCLPPFRWRATQSMEAFAISEPVTNRLLTWFVRLGSQWFELTEDRAITFDDLVAVMKGLNYTDGKVEA